MYFLVYNKYTRDSGDEPEIRIESFPDRKSLLSHALDYGIRLNNSFRVKIINGETGVERGTNDIRAELMELEVADVKKG